MKKIKIGGKVIVLMFWEYESAYQTWQFMKLDPFSMQDFWPNQKASTYR